jgi:hypothetical protein
MLRIDLRLVGRIALDTFGNDVNRIMKLLIMLKIISDLQNDYYLSRKEGI